jgi:MFS transporter, putative metabolite transport protein
MTSQSTAVGRPAPPRERLSRFHLRITALTFGANFSDGYALGSIGIALTLIGSSMHVSALWSGLIASSVLIGIFVGSITCGWLGDLFGRRLVYTLDFILIAVASAAQFFVHEPATLFVLRLLIGFGVGADYALGPTLVAEFVPARFRGGLLATLTCAWTVGYTAAYFIGTWISTIPSDSGWRWLLASGAVPAIAVLVLRLGTPESPRWLITRGRLDEARAIVAKYMHGDLDVDAVAREHSTAEPGRYRDLFRGVNLRHTIFGTVFYNAQVIPYFAIYTFLPVILAGLGMDADGFASGVLLNVFLLLGGIVGLWAVAKIGRRPLIIWTFGITALALVGVSFGSHAPLWLVLPAFLVFTFVMSGATNLDQVYPPELFPTNLRGAGVGLLNGVSRIGSAVGTFLLPEFLGAWGITTTLLCLAGVLAVGMVVSIVMAPETSHVTVD